MSKLILIDQDIYDRINGYQKNNIRVGPRELSVEAQEKYGYKYALSSNNLIHFAQEAEALMQEGVNLIEIANSVDLFPRSEI